MYLLTGAAGFIGYHVAQALLANGHNVCGLDNLNDYYDVRLKQARLGELTKHKNFQFNKIDLSDLATVNAVISTHKPTHIIHLAAQAGVRKSFTDPHIYTNSNLIAFVNMLEAAKNCNNLQHFVYASSSSVYGDSGDGPRSLDAPCDEPISLYAATKRSGELLAYSYNHMHGLPTTGLRFFTVYGSWGRPDMAYYTFTNAIMRNEKLTVFGDGSAARDFTHIADIVDGVIAATAKPSNKPQIFNLGNDHPETVKTLITTLETLTNKKANIAYQDKLAGEVQKTWADISVSKNVLGFKPKIDLTTGLAEFITWYKTFHS